MIDSEAESSILRREPDLVELQSATLRVLKGGMAKTPPKAKKQRGAIVPIAERKIKNKIDSAVLENRRGAIVEMLLGHPKTAEMKADVLRWLPNHKVRLTAGDERGVKAILEALASHEIRGALQNMFSTHPR